MAIPLPLLHTFVVAARCTSMKAAARHLGVTPGAISQRVRTLEDWAGQRLFTRGRSGITLTGAGRKLFAKIDEPFRTIESAQKHSPRPGLAKRLVVNAAPSFAATWLVPRLGSRLGSFAVAHPDIEIVVESDIRLIDLRNEPVDLGIRHGFGTYPGLKSIWLMAPRLAVIASPQLVHAGPPIRKPADCLQYPLLQDSGRNDWPLWFAAHGVDAPNADRGPAFSDDYLLVRAAAAGQGLALVREIYVNEEVAAGRLVRCPTEFAYYLVGTRAGFAKPAARRFADWLVRESHAAEGPPDQLS